MSRLKIKALTLALAVPILFVACESDEPTSIVESDTSQQFIYKTPRKWGEETLGVDTAAFKAIAQKLVMSNMPISVCEDVHQIIQNSMDAGLGEACYIREVISDSPKMWIPESTQTTNFFNNILKFSFTEESTDSIYVTQDILDKVQICWPYSENWDGVTKPLITWYGERYNSSTNFAYVYSNGQLRRIHVDDEYAQEHPVWIINSAIYPHSCFPVIVNNQNTRLMGTGVLVDLNGYITKFMHPKLSPDGDNLGSGEINSFIEDENEINSNKYYKISIGSLKVNSSICQSFDEGDIHISFWGAYVDNTRQIQPIRINRIFTKSEIGIKENGYFDLFTWVPNLQNFALIVFKQNNISNNCTYLGTLSYKESNFLYRELDFSIGYSSEDFVILQQKYSKSTFFINNIIKNKFITDDIEWQFLIKQDTM